MAVSMLPLVLLFSLGRVGAQWLPRGSPAANWNDFKRVITISIDGMHSSDVAKWLAIKPNGSIAGLVEHGYEYTDAWYVIPICKTFSTLQPFHTIDYLSLFFGDIH